ncbi:Eco57I restriction-modification methylase domain-containing protein [Acinetobacter baumannii]|uniref:Eco57I restriction-modification methylase domain-containing protein n=1 Tax=Acinetobacter calcoaceticus/baumannii complex TaxID=909768 RepID=UPI0038925FDA
MSRCYTIASETTVINRSGTERRGAIMQQQLERADIVRRIVTPKITQRHKAKLGQFLTPSRIARFMASLFPSCSLSTCKLLDAGAGVGALSCAFIDRLSKEGFDFNAVEVTAYEIDANLSKHLKLHLEAYKGIKSRIIEGDYIELSTADDLFTSQSPSGFTHVILNPPYKKINSNSAHRQALRRIGIETVNLYTAFVALSITQAAPNGQIVAIIPRSFCNGPYYRSFREFLLEHTSIEHIHLFDRRDSAFSEDNVLQENIIIRLVKGGKQQNVTITQSTDDSFSDIREQVLPFNEVVMTDDAEHFIHIPDGTPDPLASLTKVRHTLNESGISVSTGPVVDFRVRDYLRKMPDIDSVPLIYPIHLNGTVTTWPLPDIKKWNAIIRNEETQRSLFPGGTYVLLRRFSSKEEKRRLHVSLLRHADLGNPEWIGFENHTNVFHCNKKGLPEDLALGLYCWLHSTALDQHLRRFSGHTQINATDLRNIRHPGSDDLIALGKIAKSSQLDQATIDQLVNQTLS